MSYLFLDIPTQPAACGAIGQPARSYELRQPEARSSSIVCEKLHDGRLQLVPRLDRVFDPPDPEQWPVLCIYRPTSKRPSRSQTAVFMEKVIFVENR